MTDMILIEDGYGQIWMMAPAAFVSASIINRMARNARGIVSLAMERERFAALGLDFLPDWNRTQGRVDCGVSFEVREGESTGISAADRAVTIRAIAQDDMSPGMLAMRGHIAPLVARPGGVAERAGFAELAVSILRAAGLPPLAVACGVMTADGNDAGPEDVETTATLRDLAFLRQDAHSDLARVIGAAASNHTQSVTKPECMRPVAPLRPFR